MSYSFDSEFSEDREEIRKVKKIILNFNIENTLTLKKHDHMTLEENVMISFS